MQTNTQERSQMRKVYLKRLIMLALIPLVLFPIIRHIIYPNEYNGQQICIVSENGKYHFVDLQNKKSARPNTTISTRHTTVITDILKMINGDI